MKIIKIENSYDLGNLYSNISFEGAWKKLVNYVQSNNNLLNKVTFLKDQNTIILQSTNDKNLISIIKEIDPSNFFQKILLKTIKLNLKFNKETKELEIDESLNDEFDDINTINYNVLNEANSKNEVFFSEDSLNVNYENISNEDFNNFEYRIGILFFVKTKTIKDENNEIISNEDTDEYLLILYNKNTDKLKFINFEILNKENEMFNLSLFITKINNNENINFDEFNVENGLESYKFSNIKLAKTLISVSEPSENAILLFKNSLNKYIFDNFIKLQKERNSRNII